MELEQGNLDTDYTGKHSWAQTVKLTKQAIGNCGRWYRWTTTPAQGGKRRSNATVRLTEQAIYTSRIDLEVQGKLAIGNCDWRYRWRTTYLHKEAKGIAMQWLVRTSLVKLQAHAINLLNKQFTHQESISGCKGSSQLAMVTDGTAERRLTHRLKYY